MIIFVIVVAVIVITIIASIITKVQSYGEKYIITLEELPKDSDSIIVLGAGIKNDGTPTDILKDRLETSIEVCEKSGNKTFILTGDHSREDYDEVRAMKNYVMENDIDEDKIFMDHAGFSTYESMYRAKKIFDVKKAIIVTNEYHLPRAIYIARKLGIEAYGVPSDKRGYMFMGSYKKRERLAQLKDFMYVNILKPEPTFLGETIPVSTSDGRITDDNKEL